MEGAATAIRSLRRLARPREAQEVCELCTLALPAEHRHLLERGTGGMVCACDACALRFQGVVGGRFKLIPRDSRCLLDFDMSEADWQALGLPLKLGFVFESSRAKRITAMYPSPGGPTESTVSGESWLVLTTKNPVLRSLEPDVEALLVNRVNDARDYFTAPIDVCYGLVGLVRTHWRGFSGGDEVWQQLQEFFSRLAERSEMVRCRQPEVAHA